MLWDEKARREVPGWLSWLHFQLLISTQIMISWSWSTPPGAVSSAPRWVWTLLKILSLPLPLPTRSFLSLKKTKSQKKTVSYPMMILSEERLSDIKNILHYVFWVAQLSVDFGAGDDLAVYWLKSHDRLCPDGTERAWDSSSLLSLYSSHIRTFSPFKINKL